MSRVGVCDGCGARIVTASRIRSRETCVAQAEWDKARARAIANLDALIALDALGEAIATVARATLIVRVAVGHSVRVDLGDGTENAQVLELWQRGASLCLSEYAYNRSPRRLWQIEGQPEDNAAEAVARLIELVEERAR